jgi:hypothetical protein
MVVEETDRGREWLKNHELNPLLARPNPDYGMARLVEATETYLCLTGRCLWVKNRDRAGPRRVAVSVLTATSSIEVDGTGGSSVASASAAPSSGRRTWSITRTSRRPIRSAASRRSTRRWRTSTSRSSSQSRIREARANAMMPGGIYVADKDWRPTDDEFDRLKPS